MAVKKITKRWMANSLGVILIVLVALEILISVAIKNYYYGSVQKAVEAQSETISGLLNKYASEGTGDYGTYFRSIVASFGEKDKMELMVFDVLGDVTMTSSGFIPEDGALTPDCSEAMTSESMKASYTGDMNGEKVFSMTVVPNESDSEYFAYRLVTSLSKIDSQITLVIIITAVICLAIIMFVIASSSYFINSIVIPVSQIGDTAKKIAGGDFDSKIKRETDDEIGDLCDTINYMAEELGETERMKNEFISSVSHELRTPLTAIKGWAEMLRDVPNPDRETVEKGMSIIVNETDRLSVMVEELLDFSRLQSGRMVLQPIKLDIAAELSEAVFAFEQRAKTEQKNLIYKENEEIIAVMGDRNRLHQVFVNIIDNAIKYSDAGDSVTVTADKTNDGFAEIRVADTGVGIPADQLEKVKTKFFKGNATRRGSGIGLAVADEIIKMHGGELNIESVEGEGTTVIIRLPISE